MNDKRENHRGEFPPVWVISLPESENRRRGIRERLERLGVPFEFFEAKDGANLPRADLDELYDPVGALECTGSVLTLGQIGTSLSHMSLWSKMLDEGVEEVIVMEDDAVPTVDFLPVVRNRHKLSKDWELLLMYSGPTRWSIWRQRKITSRSRSVRYVSGVAGAVAYLLKASGARKLLRAGLPLRAPVDYLTGGWVDTGIHRYGIMPNCVEHLDGPSTRSLERAVLPDDFVSERLRIDRRKRMLFRIPERWVGVYRRLNPYYAFKD